MFKKGGISYRIAAVILGISLSLGSGVPAYAGETEIVETEAEQESSSEVEQESSSEEEQESSSEAEQESSSEEEQEESSEVEQDFYEEDLAPEGVTIYPTNVTTAASGNVLVGIRGTFHDFSTDAYLKKVNEVRKEAYDNCLIDPTDSTHTRRLKPEDYVPLKWSNELETIASIRAAESSIQRGHSRPNVNSNTFGISINGVTANNEIIAFNNDPIHGIKNDDKINDAGSWYAEKPLYENGNYSDAGHYITLISPANKYIGISSFKSENTSGQYSDYMSVQGEASSRELSTSQSITGRNGECIQTLEVKATGIQSLVITGINSLIYAGDNVNLECDATLYYVSEFSWAETTLNCPVYSNLTWSSSNPQVATIDSKGQFTAVESGKTTISATVQSGTFSKTVEREVYVVPEGVTISEVIPPDDVYAEMGDQPDLPATVNIRLSDDNIISSDVSWDKLGSTHSVYGKAFDTTVKGNVLGEAVSCKVHVKNDIVTSVQLSSTATVETASGTAFKNKLPIVVNYSCKKHYTHNGSSTYAFYPIVWNENDLLLYKQRCGGDFTVHGKLYNYDIEVPLKVNPATITSVTLSSTTISTPSGTALTEAQLPKAKVVYSNGDVEENMAVVWNQTELSAVDFYSRAGGTYTINGTAGGCTNITGQAVSITLTVQPAYVTEITLPWTEKSVAYKETITYPATGQAKWSNNDVETVSLSWNANDKAAAAAAGKEGGTYTVRGSAQGKNFSVAVKVAPAEIIEVGKLSDISVYTGHSFSPAEKAAVKWTGGEITYEAISWDDTAVEYHTAGEYQRTGHVFDKVGRSSEVTQNVLVSDAKLTGMVWITKPEKKTYYIGEDGPDHTGGVIKLTYEDGTEKTIKAQDSSFTVSGFDTTAEKKVTVTYSYSESFTDSTGTESVVSRSLTSEISVLENVIISAELFKSEVVTDSKKPIAEKDLPKAHLKYLDGTEKDVVVDWNQTELAEVDYMSASGGLYTVTGLAGEDEEQQGWSVSLQIKVVPAPMDKLTVVSLDDTKMEIVLSKLEGCEYSKDMVNWQASNVFSGLGCNEDFTFYARRVGAYTYDGFNITSVKASTPWPFNDVKAPDENGQNAFWGYGPVKFAYDRGLIKGYSGKAGTFGPNDNIKRGDFVLILYRMYGNPKVTSIHNFTDIKKEKYYYNAVQWAYSKGIVSGYTDLTFGGEDFITREQMAVMLRKLAALKGADVSATADISVYSDCTKISSWAFEHVGWAISTGIIKGKGADIIGPKDNATRAETATMLMRFINTFGE